MDSSFVKPLIMWYNENSRTLPWRGAGDPYRIWISEIMLQQTRVEAVTGYYRRFLEALPTVFALAECPEDQLLKLWEGLGYYSRARNLQKAARIICEVHGGKLPRTAAELKRLPGIGDYTAGAIASIAFGEAEPAVDGNVLRVYSRLTALEEDILRDTVRKKIRSELRSAHPEADGSWGILNQAFMDLGSGICKANARPDCGKCPLESICLAHKEGREEDFPRRENKTKRHEEERTVFLIRCGETFAIAKRPADGLLANLYEFPNCRGWLTEAEASDYLAEKGCRLPETRPLPESRHVFSHLTWRMHAYAVRLTSLAENGDWIFVEPDEIQKRYPVPSAFAKYIACMAELAGEGDSDVTVHTQARHLLSGCGPVTKISQV